MFPNLLWKIRYLISTKWWWKFMSILSKRQAKVSVSFSQEFHRDCHSFQQIYKIIWLRATKHMIEYWENKYYLIQISVHKTYVTTKQFISNIEKIFITTFCHKQDLTLAEITWKAEKKERDENQSWLNRKTNYIYIVWKTIPGAQRGMNIEHLTWG